MYLKYLEWSATVLAIIAGTLISLNLGDIFVFVAICVFLLKEIIMLIFSKLKKLNGILACSLFFIMLNIIGIYQWWPS